MSRRKHRRHHRHYKPASHPPPVPRVFGRASRVVLNSGESVPVRYAVVEAEWLITSHRGRHFIRDDRYPAAAQPRDYAAEIELQLAVQARARALDPWQVLTDSVLPIDGPPIVRSDGAVISGNGRTQSMVLALDRGQYGAVRSGIMGRAGHFGFCAVEAAKLQRPVLVRVMDADVRDDATLARYGIEMNRDPGQGMSLSEQSMGLSRLVTPAITDRLLALMAELPEGYSVREFMRSRAPEIAAVLTSGNLVDVRKRSAYFTTAGELTEATKDLVETALAGLTVTDIEVIRAASRSTRDRLVRAGVEFMRIRAAGAEWDLAARNNAAVALVTLAEDRAGYLRSLKGIPGDDSLVARLVHPERYRNATEEMGFAPSRRPEPSVEALALCLELNPKEYVAAISAYAIRAAGAWRSMFECLHPADSFTETIGSRFGITVLPEVWIASERAEPKPRPQRSASA